MAVSKLTKRAMIAGVVVAVSTRAALAAQTTIHVTLWDKGADSATIDDAHPMMMGTGGADMTMAMLGVKVDLEQVKAGTVTFDVANASKDIVHEMVLSPVNADEMQLPYLAADYKVDEDASMHLGEVSKLDPGKAGSVTVELSPGTYALYCNIPGHFQSGMWTKITVTD